MTRELSAVHRVNNSSISPSAVEAGAAPSAASRQTPDIFREAASSRAAGLRAALICFPARGFPKSDLDAAASQSTFQSSFFEPVRPLQDEDRTSTGSRRE